MIIIIFVNLSRVRICICASKIKTKIKKYIRNRTLFVSLIKLEKYKIELIKVI